MATSLTARTVETAKAGSVRREIADAHMPGLYLVVQPSGVRSWAVRYRQHGRSRKHTLGTYPTLDLKVARELAGKALRAAAEGRDPGTEKAKARAANEDSVEKIAAQFIERHCKKANRPRTVEETARLLKLHVLPRWRHRSIHEITRRDVLELLDRVVDAGKPIAANRTFSAVRKMFSWGVARDIIAASPCVGVEPPTAEHSRDRVLTDSELRDVWVAADTLAGPYGALVKLLILTGQRRDECAAMRWAELDLQTRLWTLPPERVKNNRPHEVPLSDAAVAVLQALPHIGDRFVLTITGDRPRKGYSNGKQRLDGLLPPDMPAWRLHDLRRTMASGMARLGINLPAIEKVLNHTSGSFGGIVGVYQRHDFADEKRRALDTWGAFVTDLVGKKPRKNVVALRGRGHA